MIRDDDILSLPDDPLEAFVRYEELLRGQYLGAFEDSQQGYFAERKYVNALLAFLDEHEIEIDGLEFPPRDDREFYQFYTAFQNKIEYWITRFRISHLRLSKQSGSVVEFTPELKRKVHFFIDKIRQIVLTVELDVAKRERVTDRLNALAAEVDRDRTKTQSLLALTLEVANTGGEVGKKLIPLKEVVDSITEVFAKAKELGDQLSLPSRREPKRISPPRSQPETTVRPDTLDDDIPF